MSASLPIRSALLLGLWMVAICPLASSQGRGHGAPPTAHGSAYVPRPADAGRSRGNLGRGPGQEHLAEWMNRHSQLSPAEQQRALEREPGFRTLAPPVQQRMRDRLNQLDSMSPERRQRVIARTEAMERLAPEQRQQIRGSMQQLSSLPPDQRHAVAQAFRQYRSLSPQERQNAVNSGRFVGTLSPEGRAAFGNLVNVEPFLPPPPSAQHPQP